MRLLFEFGPRRKVVVERLDSADARIFHLAGPNLLYGAFGHTRIASQLREMAPLDAAQVRHDVDEKDCFLFHAPIIDSYLGHLNPHLG